MCRMPYSTSGLLSSQEGDTCDQREVGTDKSPRGVVLLDIITELIYGNARKGLCSGNTAFITSWRFLQLSFKGEKFAVKVAVTAPRLQEG